MSLELVPVETIDLTTKIQEASARAKDYASKASAGSTMRAYRADWADFTTWCQEQNRLALPAAPETVALYLADRATTCKVATLQRRISAISRAHQAAGYPGISTREEPLHSVWRGIRREHGTAQQGKAPTMTEDIKAMVTTLPDNFLGARDRALLLLGFATAFRRSELVSLDVSDVTFTRDGLVVTLRRSKTDQEGAGRKVGIPFSPRPQLCPVRALQAWLETSGITEGALFRSINRHGKLQPGRDGNLFRENSAAYLGL